MSSTGSPSSPPSRGRTRPSISPTYRTSEPGRATSVEGPSASATWVRLRSTSAGGAGPGARVVGTPGGGRVVVGAARPPSSPSSPHPASSPATAPITATARRIDVTLPARRAGGSADLADEALLHDRGDERAVPGEDQAAGQASAAAGARAVLGVQQPVVGPAGPGEPHGVVQAGQDPGGAGPAGAVGERGRVEQRHVGRVREHDRVQQRVVREPAVGA